VRERQFRFDKLAGLPAYECTFDLCIQYNSTLVAVQIYKKYLQQLLQGQEPLVGTLVFGELGVGPQSSGGGGQVFAKL